MKVVYFTHSLTSCWNHGNAHFLRGVLRNLVARGHQVRVYEPEGSWSLTNLLDDHGDEGLEPWRRAYPDLHSETFSADLDLAETCDGADLVLVHEWNEPLLVAHLGKIRSQGAGFTLLFHDTHHRAVSDPDALNAFTLDGYDGVLAFGEALAQVYRRWGWGERVFVWHEAADITVFHPPTEEQPKSGLVWIGNWGDGERAEELQTFLLEPAKAAALPLEIYGVRYPEPALALLKRYGVQYRGWIANARAPDVFAQHLATVHVPRRFYVKQLPGIPTIRIFEALACGIPLVCSPWQDIERLFRGGEDFLMADDGAAMVRQLTALKTDAGLRAALVKSGLETILARHTCAHRVDELLAIYHLLRAPLSPASATLESAL